MNKQHWQDWINLLLGIWIYVSPWVIGRSLDDVVVANYSIVGMAVVALAVACLVAFRLWEERATLLLGFWLLISPWVLGFRTSAAHFWNAVIIGALLIVHAIWVLAEVDREKSTPE